MNPVHPFARFRFVRPALLLLFGPALTLSATEYYVDYAAGADTNAGVSTTQAWRHCPGDPASSGLAAAARLAPGDTVHFKGGVTYVFTAGTGIALQWNGAAGQPITYDGNASGLWGSGRAKFTDNYSARGITAFSAAGGANDLAFVHLDIGALGGDAVVPPDLGTPAPSKFGGGIVFGGAVTGIRIDSCVFHHLGYTFSQRPMAASSIAGTGVGFPGGSDVSITNCSFSQHAIGIDLSGSTSLANLTIADCSFSDGMVWTIVQPADISLTHISVYGCTEQNNGQFDRLAWAGYGESPRVVPELVPEGAGASFTASAIATPGASFQWRKNGAPIVGATAASLALSPVTLADAGTYTVEATNSAGTTLSNEAVLIVVPAPSTPGVASAPVITSQPVSVTAPALSTATFAVTASGNPAPLFQWLKNGVPIAGWTQASLVLEGISANDVASYSVVVTNVNGTVTSNPAALTIGAAGTTVTPPLTAGAPTIETQPIAVTALPLSTAVFSVKASGNPAPSYQWMRNGTPISGWTNATLRLEGVSANDVGTYQVVVANSLGSVTSEPVALTLTSSIVPVSVGAPVITAQPLSVVVAPLSRATFSASASGAAPLAYQWLKNGVAIAGWTNASLTLDGISANDVGTYQVVVTNPAGKATSTPATLSLKALVLDGSVPPLVVTPSIILQPVSVVAAPLSTAVFTVQATGTSTLTYQWLKNGAPVTGWTNATLSLQGVSINDAGVYRVIVTGSGGSVTSDAALLSIGTSATLAPTITLQPVSRTATALSTTTFKVGASGSPTPTIQWFRNGVAIAGWTGATLTLEGLSSNDSGTYTAVATNAAGSATSAAATLTVSAK